MNFTIGIIVALALLWWMSMSHRSRLAAITRQLNRLENKIDHLLEAQGVGPEEESSDP